MTVSNVMNNRPVSESTRKQVLEAMRLLNYQPSAIARGLNRKPMDTLGIVLPHTYHSPTSHPYYAPVLDGIMAAAVVLHKDVTIYTGNLCSEDGVGFRRYRDGRADGLIMIGRAIPKSQVQSLIDVGLPIVTIGNYYESPEINTVGIDNGKSMAALVRHLADLGHERIAFLEGVDDEVDAGPRLGAFFDAVEAAGLRRDLAHAQFPGFTAPKIQQAVDVITAMPLSKRPTAVCAFNDELALATIEGLARAGIRVPEDISVTGFDDTPAAIAGNVTTMRQPMRKIGMRGAQILVDVLRGDVSGPICETFETEIVVRGTTGPVKA